MNRILPPVIFLWFYIFCLLPTLHSFSTEGGGHPTITSEASEVAGEAHGDSLSAWLFDREKGSLPDLLTGAYDEDCTPINSGAMQELPLDGSWPRGPNGWGNFFEHFFNPRTGAGLWSNRTAIARAEEYERTIRNIICDRATRYDKLPEMDRRRVNDYFGRLMHLLEDMGMSYHTKLEVHPFKWDKPLEHYVETNWDEIAVSDLFQQELLNATYLVGICIDPTVPMFRLAQWSNGLPANHEYWECVSLPGQYCELKTDMVADYATRMSARATAFTKGYINQLWEAINSNCICSPATTGVSRGQPDDTFSVNGSFLGTTQADLDGAERLDFFLRVALKKGDISPLYTKKLIEIYAEGQSLAPDASQEAKDDIQSRFFHGATAHENLPPTSQDDWPDIALLQRGYHDEALSLINRTKEPVRYIKPDFDPSLLRSNPVLIIPSGGLMGLEKSAFFKASLDQYVRLGGTVVAFAQPYGYHFAALPVPQEQDGTLRPVNGYGWEEDQNCFVDAVYLDSWHQLFAGQSRSTPSMNVDGYFTDYPSKTLVLLRRTANGQPAMLSYEHGQGRVIATSMYSDFAFGQSQSSPEERALIRDMISWAKKPAQLPDAVRGETISFTVDVANHTDTDAASAKLLTYSPDRSVLVSEETISGSVPAHGSTRVATQFAAAINAQRGIYHVDYELLDAQGTVIQPQTETDSGRFVISEPPSNPYRNSDLNFSVTTNVELVTPGSDVTFTVHAWNNTEQQKTVTVRYVFPHMYLMTSDASYGVFAGWYGPGGDTGWLTKSITVGPQGRASFNHIMKNAQHDEFIFANFYDEENKLVGRVQRGFFLFQPSAQATVSTTRPTYLPGETVTVNAEFTNLGQNGFGATARIRVLNQDGSTLIEEERPVDIPADGVSRLDVALRLPETLSRGKYPVTATLWCGYYQLAMVSTSVNVESVFSTISVVPHLPRSIVGGLNDISFTLHNAWGLPVNSGILEVDLHDPQGTSIARGTYPFALAPGETKVINTPLVIPDRLFGDYFLYYTQSDETGIGGSARITLPSDAVIGLMTDKPAYQAGEVVGISTRILNNGRFELSDIEVSVAIPDLGLSDTRVVRIPVDERITIPFTFVLPNNSSPGHYSVNTTMILPSGNQRSQSVKFEIPPPRLVLTVPGPREVTSGSVIQVLIENTGGADTRYAGTIAVRDRDDVAVYERNVEGAIKVSETKTLADITLPSETAQGKHILTVALHDVVGNSNPLLKVSLDVTGSTARLQTRSPKDVYFQTEPVSALSDIINGAVGLSGGSLHVTVDTFSGHPGFSHFLPKDGWMDVTPLAVAVSGDGSVYIAEYSRIMHFDSMWNLLDEWGSYGSDQGQFNGVTDLAVGQDGLVYVVDKGNHRIQKFTSYGAFLQMWGSRGSGDGQFLSPTGLAVDAEGAIYVADASNDRIQKFSENGTFLAKWGFSGFTDGYFNQPSGVAAGPDGSIYVADTGNHRMQRFTSDGVYMTKWGSEGYGDGQFFRPHAVTVGADGSVYVGNNDRIQKFTADGVFVSRGGSSGIDQGQFLEIGSVTTGPDGSVYAVDMYNGDIQRFDSDLGFVSHWASHGSQNGWFHHPTHVALTPDGYLYVSDKDNNRIQKFDKNGRFVKLWGSEGSGGGEFLCPAGIAAGPDGSLYVADYYNHRIQKFDKEGRFLTTWGNEGAAEGQFSHPDGIAVNSQGEVYVADRLNYRVQKFNANGAFISQWSTGMPEGIGVSPDGWVYVFDYVYQPGWSKRIQKFDGNGNYIAEWEWWSWTDSGGITVDGQGVVYLADGLFVHVFDGDGNYMEQLEAPGECTGVAVASDGTLYCADTDLSRILKHSPHGPKTVFEDNIPLNLLPQEQKQELTSIGVMDEPGKYFLHATLTNALGQKIARSEYAFYVVKDNLALTFFSDKKTYKPGETVRIEGEVRNFTALNAEDVSLAIHQQIGGDMQPLYSAIISVPANGTQPFTVIAQAGLDGTYSIRGILTHGGETVFEVVDQYEVAATRVAVNLTAPDTAGRDIFSVSLEIENEGTREAEITLTSPFDTQVLKVAAGDSLVITYGDQHIDRDTAYTFILTGDVNQTISKTVYYGLAAALTIQAAPMYPEGTVAVPIWVGNEGSLDMTVSVDALLVPSGFLYRKTYFIPQSGGASDTLIFALTEGEYRLTLTSQGLPVSASTTFSVRKETNAEMSPVVTAALPGGLINVSSNVTNRGCRDLVGTIKLSLFDARGGVVWESQQALNLEAREPLVAVPVNVTFPSTILQPGNYTIKMVFLNEGYEELVSRESQLPLSGPHILLAQVPTYQTVGAGQEAVFVFKINNGSLRDGPADLTFRSGDFINLTRHEWLSAGTEKEVVYAFPIPPDLETKDYLAEYELKSEGISIARGQIKYHVTGINIGVTASLDKANYHERDVAHLNLNVTDKGGVSGGRNLFARVNYGDYEGKQTFTLMGSQSLSFNIPLTAITGEKLFYGIYDEGGRSIHLNSLYIYKAGDFITITTDKQVYNPGETVVMNIGGTATGSLNISSTGGYEETFSFTGSASRSFELPRVALAGTYFINARLATPNGDSVTAVKPFDIAGISVKVKEAFLDKGKYMPGDTARLSMRIQSNVDMAAVLKVWSVGPDKSEQLLGESQVQLSRPDQVMASAVYPLTITSSGIHQIIYGIYAEQLLLASGDLSFDAGNGVILGMTTDQQDYQLGSEPVAISLNLFGTTEATLLINLNGVPVRTEAVNLNGFSQVSFQVTPPGPGAYTLTGVLTSGGLSSAKKTTFLYGTNAPDLSADIWGSGAGIGKDGTLKLIASVRNQGKAAAPPSSMSLYDGTAYVAEFSGGELLPGASQSFEYPWNVIGKAGEHTLVAVLDPGNSFTEFTKENNRVTRRIVIPDIALITEIEKKSYRIGEEIAVNATMINLTAGTNYPNLTCTTTINDPAGTEILRQNNPLSLAPSQDAAISVRWSTGNVPAEGKYMIRQAVSSGAAILNEKTKIVTVTAGAGFALRVDPAELRIKQGEVASFTISVDAIGGWNGPVTLEADGVPASATATFSPGVVVGSGTVTLLIKAGNTAAPGAYSITLRARGSDGSPDTVQTVPVILEISGFDLQVEPQSLSVTQQDVATFTLKTLSLHGYEGRVAVSALSEPIGQMIVTVAHPDMAVPDGETIIRVETSRATPPGTYTVTASASDGITTKSVNAALLVTENAEIASGFLVTPGPGYSNQASVSLMSRGFEALGEFVAFETRFGANAVMGDIDGDGLDEIIVAPGPDPLTTGRVRVFSRHGDMLVDQPVFATKSGATLAAGDVDGDWREEIVVGAGPGLRNAARIKVLSFDGEGFVETGINFVAFPDSYRFGVKLALGDVNGDGVPDIIAGAGPSPINPARVKVFSIDTRGGLGRWSVASTLSDFLVDFGDWYPYFFGVNVAAGDVDGDGMAEIIAGAGPNPLQRAVVAVYKGDGTFTGTRFEAYPSEHYRFGVNVAARDLDGDGRAEIITGPGPSPFSDSWVRVFRGDGSLLSHGFVAFPEAMKFGAKVSGRSGEE